MDIAASLLNMLGTVVFVVCALIGALFWIALVGGVTGTVIEAVRELLGVGKPSEELTTVVDSLPTEDEIRALGVRGDEEAVASLVRVIENDDSPRVGEALEALGSIADDSAALALIGIWRAYAEDSSGIYLDGYSGYLEDVLNASAAANPTPYIAALGDEHVGSAAADALVEADDPRTIEPIIEIAIAEPRARDNAVDALGYLSTATRAVLDALSRSDLDADIRSRFSSLVLEDSGPEVNRFARLAVRDPSAKLRKEAIDYVVHRIAAEDMEEGFDLLEAALADEDPQVSFSAAGYLVRLCGTGHPLVLTWVLDALSDPDPLVQDRGLLALSGETDVLLIRPLCEFLRARSEAAMASADDGTSWEWLRRTAREALGRVDARYEAELAAARPAGGALSAADFQYANVALASAHPTSLLRRLDAGWLKRVIDIAAAAIDATRPMEHGWTRADAIGSTGLRDLTRALDSTCGPAGDDLPADPVMPDTPTQASEAGHAASPEATEECVPGLAEVRLRLQSIEDDNADYRAWIRQSHHGLGGAMARGARNKKRMQIANEFDETVPRALVRLIVGTAEAATSWVQAQEDGDSGANQAAEDTLLESVKSLRAALKGGRRAPL